MKKYFKFAVMAMAGMVLMTACGPKSDLEGFKKTKSGLHYRYDVQNKDGQQVQPKDVLVCEVAIMVGSETDTVFNSFGNPDRMFKVMDEGQFEGDLMEGLKMMRIGDKMTFAIEMDSLARFYNPNQMPPQYQPNQGMKMYYTVALSDVISEDEMAKEQARYMENMQQRQDIEADVIAKYITDNNITTAPSGSGVYVIVKKKGNGPKVAAGKHVKIDYTGRLVENGNVFDTSVESVAVEAGIADTRRTYEPLEYTVGEMSLIPGWEEGVMGQPQGTELTLVIPSSQAYGPQGAGKMIEPYSPLTFDITIVEVK